jgi:hypothetical protein
MIYQIFTLCITTGSCGDENCCACREKPNQDNGNGFFEFNQDCLNNGGGLNCISNTGCRLCYKPTFGATNIGQRPICTRFLGLVGPAHCTDLNCCLNNQNPNPTNGVGYLEFSQSCLNNGGGLNCVADTGCQLCYKPISGGSNLGDRPTCARFLNMQPQPFTFPPTCSNQTCCIDAQTPNEADGNGFLEFNQNCFNNGGGVDCVGASGCRLCYKPTVGGVNIGPRPTCLRYLNLLPPCHTDQCCFDIQNPNLSDGNGFLEFNQNCFNNGGGLDCVEATGCKYCFMPGVLGSINVGNRPICARLI